MTARAARLGARLWLLALMLVPPSTAAETPEAVAVVDGLHGTLLSVMKEADELGYEGRYARVEPVLDRSFDIRFMGQKSVGRYWSKLSEKDRKRLLDTFHRFMVANYAGRFDGWSGEQFETLGEEPSSQGTLIVQTRLVVPDDEDVNLSYRLRPADGSWRIIDVYLNGTVSELALRRSENSSLIAREGIDALIARLEERIASLAAGRGDSEP